MRGQVHVYTGNGKGKTTAAFGVVLRAVGAGKKVFVAQFVKDMEYGEVKAVRKYLSPLVEVKLYGRGCFISRNPDQEDKYLAAAALEEVGRIMASGSYDLVVLDEANIATYFGLITPQSLVEAVKAKADATEVIITGRYASQEVLDMADLVTDMTEVRHYYANGIPSRSGIDH